MKRKTLKLQIIVSLFLRQSGGLEPPHPGLTPLLRYRRPREAFPRVPASSSIEKGGSTMVVAYLSLAFIAAMQCDAELYQIICRELGGA